jgi:3-phosphoshikimate 1-carboxyvinyltransferase
MLEGCINIPADKSISQRALIISTLAKGSFIVNNFCLSQDCISTLNVVKSLGVDVSFIDNKTLKVTNTGLIKPLDDLYCNNSGTCMRMMCGVLSAQHFSSILVGDESLSNRPMKRVIEPLELMGANIESSNGLAPLKIFGRELSGIEYNSPIASAQVKSSILLAGVQSEGETIFTEPHKSRNHTEIMLNNMGADISVFNTKIIIKKSKLSPFDISVVGDFSSAAFFIAAALIIPNSNIVLKHVGLNPTRTGFLDILNRMGADIEILDFCENNGEPYGDLRIKYSELNGVCVEGDIIPNAIDELPLLALLGACAKGTTILKDAQELRKKESDRISAIVLELRKLGIAIEETADGFIVTGKQIFKGGVSLDSHCDHRIAMCLYIAGTLCDESVSIKNFDSVNISFPEFKTLYNLLLK